ncbi:hypothetical protein [Burkholderia plantarii]|uniref:hypothetical protein n=1 Tax=Burkholderia plantarii TaxID=41899 RepID=UPI000F50A382|nr:hypothetical protein [Burkholderia plantarii]
MLLLPTLGATGCFGPLIIEPMRRFAGNAERGTDSRGRPDIDAPTRAARVHAKTSRARMSGARS